MKLREIAERIKARPLTFEVPLDHEVRDFVASNRVSELLNGLTSQTLLVTSLLNSQILKVAELMDVRGICFTNHTIPDPAVIETASKLGIALMETESDVKTVSNVLTGFLRDKGGLNR